MVVEEGRDGGDEAVESRREEEEEGGDVESQRHHRVGVCWIVGSKQGIGIYKIKKAKLMAI